MKHALIIKYEKFWNTLCLAVHSNHQKLATTIFSHKFTHDLSRHPTHKMQVSSASCPRRNVKMLSHVLALLASWASLTAADLDVRTYNYGSGIFKYGTWSLDYDIYSIDVCYSCYKPDNVPGLNQLCLDLDQRKGNFTFDKQVTRCLLLGEAIDDDSDYCKQPNCNRSVWDEVKCSN